MKTIYGVKMETPINKKLKNGHTMYDWVTRKNCFPVFCMRTLCGDNKITAEEIEYLKRKNCRIALVLNDLTEAEVSSSKGALSALRAAEAAKAAGFPENRSIAIFADIKPKWSINHNWMILFAQTMKANGFIPGFIGNKDSSKNFSFDRQCSHYVKATKEIDYWGAIFMSTEPKCEAAPEIWEPYCPSSLNRKDMSLWACGKTVFDETEADDIYARDEKVLAYMWDYKEGEMDEQKTV